MIRALVVLSVIATGCPRRAPVQQPERGTAVGLKALTVADPMSEKTLSVLAFYPPAAPAVAITEIGPYPVEGTYDAPAATGTFPLVMISHGHAGSRLGHHAMAVNLARAGYVVVAIEHAGDSWNDQATFGTDRSILGRAMQASRAIDAALADSFLGPLIDPTRIGALGFSAGGHTSLLLVGAKPDLSRIAGYCARHPEDPEICASRPPPPPPMQPAPVTVDPRVRAAFVMGPLGIFFDPASSFASVTAPVALVVAEKDDVLRHDENGDVIRRGLTTLKVYFAVPGAEHYVFLSPCTPAFADEVPKLCRDPEGVNRVAVHRDLNVRAREFFDATLKPFD